MRFIDPKTLCQPQDLIVPHGWSGPLNEVYCFNNKKSPYTIFNTCFLGNNTVPDWMYRPYFEFCSIPLDSPIIFGDIVSKSVLAGSQEYLRSVVCTDFDFFLNGVLKSCRFNNNFSGRLLSEFMPIDGLGLYRRKPRFNDTIICDGSLLRPHDVITYDDFEGDPFDDINYSISTFKSGIKRKLFYPFTGHRSLDEICSSLHLTHNIIGWRREKIISWQQIKERADTGDVLSTNDFSPQSLDIVTNTRLDRFRIERVMVIDPSNARGSSLAEICEFFNIPNLLLWRKIENIEFTPKISGRKSSSGNQNWSKPLPIP